MKKEDKKEENGLRVAAIATETEPVIVDEDEEQYSVHDVLARIANDVRVLREELVGKK